MENAVPEAERCGGDEWDQDSAGKYLKYFVLFGIWTGFYVTIFRLEG